MDLPIATMILVGATALGIAVMLLVRRRAPDGSWFRDGDRAAGVFGVLATGFSVLIGFVIFLAFQSYDSARTGAEDEALAVRQQLETAQLLPADVSAELTGELACYARSIAGSEWDRMVAGTLGEDTNPWADQLNDTFATIEPESNAEQSAYDQWLEQSSERERARNARIHGAQGVVPAPLWIVLFFSAALIVVFTVFFADRGERAVAQAVLMGSVVAALSSLLLLLYFLDTPFRDGLGGLRPISMEQTIQYLDIVLEGVGPDEPCDITGTALSGG